MPSLTASCAWGCRLKPFHVKLTGVRRSHWGTNPADAPLESDLQQKDCKPKLAICVVSHHAITHNVL